jgi:hypothetical protein
VDIALPVAAADETPAPAPVGTAGRVLQRPLTIELTTIREVWIRSAVDGQSPSARLVATGETLTFEADQFVELRVGDAGAVTLRVNGEDRGPLGRDGEVLSRRFEVDGPRPEF